MTVLVVPPFEEGEAWPTLGSQVCEYLQAYAVHGPGDLRGEPARISNERRAIIYRLYEVYPEDHPQAGRRRFKRAGLSERKGSAKTEFAAWIAQVELDPDGPVRCAGFDGRGLPIARPVIDPYIPLVAYTEEQTEDLAYGALRVMLEEGPRGRLFDIGLERIMRKSGDGVAKALASAPSARDGARTTFQHFDEPLALDTLVPTTAGWKTIREIAPGDTVYGSDGHPVAVLGVSPIHQGRECYRLTFTDETAVITDAGHLWTAIDWANRPAGEQAVTTKQMFERGCATGYGLRWRLPRGSGFDGAEAALPIDPYLLGLWLGDGATNAGYIHNSREDYGEIAARYRHTVSNDSRPGVVRWLPNGLRKALRLNGLLGNKHIPDAYLFTSRQQRIALLQGLMDSDGYTTPGGSCTFVQGGYAPTEQVAVLVRSLGVAASMTCTHDDRSKTGEMWKVHFSPHFCPFQLSRKAGRFQWGVRRSTSWPAITSIEPVASVPVRCIGVDSHDHLFVFGRGLQLTHNTHRFTLPNLKRAHTTMLANIPKRRAADAWSLETTTAYEPGAGSIAEGTHDYARKVDEGQIKDSSLFFFHRQASDKHDLDTEAGLRAAILEASGPEVAEWTDIEGIMAIFQDPSADISYQRRVWTNIPLQGSEKAFDLEAWRKLGRDDYTVADGALITLGFDGARSFDTTGLVGTEIKTGYQWVVGVWERPAHLRDDEYWEVPASEVDEAVEATFERYQVWRMYADPPYWDAWIATWAGRHGKEVVVEWWTNRLRQMAYAIKSWVNAIARGELTHEAHRTFERHVGNAVKRTLHLMDEDGKTPLWLIQKERPDSPQKIDLDMAAILSWEARMDALAAGVAIDEEPSVYEERGILVI